MARGREKKQRETAVVRPIFIAALIFVLAASVTYYTFSTISASSMGAITYVRSAIASSTAPVVPTLDKAAYTKKLYEIAYATTTISNAEMAAMATSSDPWPVRNAPYPLPGAILPFHRIVAYYGNFYSTAMGVLGEYPQQEVIQKLLAQAAQWQAADPTTPVIPAIDYIAVTAQGSPGPDGKYRLRMPDSQIDQALSMANQVHGLLFLDVQVGLSNVQTEVPLLQKYLEMPNVELNLDPEFAMQTSGMPPGTVIGTLDASDINWAANYLANLVTEYNLPPKILVVHRFTQDMVTHTDEIRPLPQVQIVMDMDGWGFPAKKINTYEQVIVPYPVQFTGFKLFYKADLQPPTDALMTPTQVLQLKPQPLFIQYQ